MTPAHEFPANAAPFIDGVQDALARRIDEFDVAGPLPHGTTLLEASAGTGKTWTIAALVTRYVAEGHARIDEILVVTFTRAASQELRERVRGQMVDALHALTSEPPTPTGNDLHDFLLSDRDARTERRQRLADALAAFDTATIATIHEFCTVVLRSLGVAGDSDREAVLVEDLDELVSQVGDDLYLAGFHAAEHPAFTPAVAATVARQAVANPDARLEPRLAVTEDPASPAGRRVRFAEAVRTQVRARKRRLGVLSFDDLLTQVADALAPDGSPARVRLRERWRIVLVDEFQDTDPVQWSVFERAFVGHSTTVLIGDPKQAIYSFRGGDVETYLTAAASADATQTLPVNHRSDAALVESLQVMLQNAELGSERITVQPVRARHTGSRLVGAGPAVRLRQVRHLDLGVRPQDKPRIDAWREHVVTDLARDVRQLLSSGARLAETSDAASPSREVLAGDVAVLAHNNATLRAVHAALLELGIPAVMSSGGSVFHTPAATEWLTLLEALEQPHRSERVRAAALTSFFGVGAVELDADLPRPGSDGADLTDQLAETMRTLATLLETRGVAAVMEFCAAQGLTRRVLSEFGGERTLTDLRHVGELLHKVAVEERRSVVGLLGWLRTQVADEGEVRGDRSRRLDSDDAAVQLVTIHSSKGLQYPIVYLPALWDKASPRRVETRLFHAEDGQRCLDVGGDSDWDGDPKRRAAAEEAGETLRMAYVALTRAQSQAVLWYAPAPWNAPKSALHRLLAGRAPGQASVPDQHRTYSDDETHAGMQSWAAQGAFGLEFADHAPVAPLPQTPVTTALTARTFTRTIDHEWRRTSYTALSAAASGEHGHTEPADLSEPGELGEVADVQNPTLDAPTADTDAETEFLSTVPSPMAELPMGATFGSLVHAVLEHADPAAADQHAHLAALVREQLVEWPVDLDPEALAAALMAVVTSPTGPLTGQRSLLEVAAADRLCEMEFELPLSGGDAATPGAGDRVTLGDLAPLLERHLPEGDAVRGYADALRRDPALAAQPLRGYLTGSIDVVMRLDVDAPEGPATRYLTVDYKTNWLGPYDEPLTAWSYRPAAMDEAMAHSDYPLQALLYTVVLHRYLRWRLPGYDPATHLGGVLYLYLRGMCGPQTPLVDGHPCGVFSWRAPVGLVEELSALLDGRLPDTRTPEHPKEVRR